MSNNIEEVPRHTPPQPTGVDNSEIPAPLQNRLFLETIKEKPPGQNLTGSAAYDVSDYPRLTVLCGDLSSPIKVEVNYLSYLSYTTFKRQDGCLWYMCHTWTRTWGEGSCSSTTFINLSTGERHDVPTMSLWRGNIQISPDGNMVLIEAGIMASSARQLLVLDISNLPTVDVIHMEEYGWGDIEISDYRFTEDNEFMCTYSYFFQVYKDKIRFQYYFGDDNSQMELKKYVLANCSENERDKIDHDDSYINITDFEGGMYVFIDCTVKRKRNENITLINNWKNDLPRHVVENNFFATILVDDMITTSVIGGDDYEEFVGYMSKGVHDLVHKRCIFCKHKCDYY